MRAACAAPAQETDQVSISCSQLCNWGVILIVKIEQPGFHRLDNVQGTIIYQPCKDLLKETKCYVRILVRLC